MATPLRRTADPVIEQLRRRPQAFGFFQALRLLRRYFDLAEQGERRFPLGFDFPPHLEVARLKASPSLAFPHSEILELEFPAAAAEDQAGSPPQVTVGFMGLTGPSGVLPRHYTQTVIDEAKGRQATPTLDFFDLFNHRAISLFYRAWEKYRLPVNFENAQWHQEPGPQAKADPITGCIYALVGMAPEATRRRQLLDDAAYLFYAGHFFSHPPNAISLQRMLGELFQLPIAVQQFRGEWLQLSDDQRTSLQSFPPAGQAANNRLGVDALAGSRVWSVEGLVRIRIGPVSYDQFQRLMPGEKKLGQIAQFVRQYVGTTLETEYQIVLAKQDVPQIRMPVSDSAAPPPVLGRTTWLLSGASPQDRDDAVLRYSGRIDCQEATT